MVKSRDKQKGDDDPRQKRADKKLGVFPVFHIGDSGHRNQGEGADFRRHKRQTSRPPGDFSPPQEKVVGGFFFSARIKADKNHQEEDHRQDGVILPGETAAAGKKGLDFHNFYKGPNYRIKKLFAWLK